MPGLSAPAGESDFYFVPAEDPETAVWPRLRLRRRRFVGGAKQIVSERRCLRRQDLEGSLLMRRRCVHRDKRRRPEPGALRRP